MNHQFNFNSSEVVTLDYILRQRVRHLLLIFSEEDLQNLESVRKEFFQTWKMHTEVHNSYFGKRNYISPEWSSNEIRLYMERGT